VILNLDDHGNGVTTAYLPIEGKGYYYYFSFRDEDFHNPIGSGTYPAFSISYDISPDDIGISDLIGMTRLKPYSQIDNNRPYRNRKYKLDSITFKIDDKPRLFSSKLKDLLLYLDTDSASIRKLADLTGSRTIWIDVQFDSKFALTSIDFDLEDINLMAKMALTPVFDIYAQ